MTARRFARVPSLPAECLWATRRLERAPAANVGAPVALGPRVRRGTARIRESVPACVAQPAGFASVRIFGTVRAERTRPAESPANRLVSGAECGASIESLGSAGAFSFPVVTVTNLGRDPAQSWLRVTSLTRAEPKVPRGFAGARFQTRVSPELLFVVESGENALVVLNHVFLSWL